MPLKPPERPPNGVEPLERPSWTRSSTTNANVRHFHVIDASVTPQGPIHGPVQRYYATGIPAIHPRFTSNSPDMPTFTVNDVKAYIPTAPYPILVPTQGTHLTIEKILFVSSQEATQLMHGESTGLPDNALVCFVLLKGPFYVQIDRPPNDPAGSAQTATEVAEVFDAHTGNLLVWAVES